ncbi:MAG: glycosyltransferase family 4 protein [bacterium]
MTKKLKILHTVEFYNPSVGGAQEVVKQLSEHLVMLGHDVTVATTRLPNRKGKVINGVKIAEFDVGGNAVRGYTGEDIKKYQDFLIKGGFDVIMNYAAQEWTADLAFEVLEKITAKKVFVPCGYSGLYDPHYEQYFATLPSVLRKYDHCVYLSDDYRDINFARANKIRNGVLIENGADEREFQVIPKVNKSKFLAKYGIPASNQIILCVSNHTGLKGHKEAIKSFNKAKISHTSLVFIGDVNLSGGCYKQCLRSSKIARIASIFHHNGKSIHILHLSRQETINFYAISDIFLFLSNIECSPLVLFESSASGVPFIASRCGNAEEIAKWTKAGIIAKSAQTPNGYTTTDMKSAVAAIEKVLADPKALALLGRNGRANWERRFTWAKLAQRYESLYNSRESATKTHRLPR